MQTRRGVVVICHDSGVPTSKVPKKKKRKSDDFDCRYHDWFKYSCRCPSSPFWFLITGMIIWTWIWTASLSLSLIIMITWNWTWTALRSTGTDQPRPGRLRRVSALRLYIICTVTAIALWRWMRSWWQMKSTEAVLLISMTYIEHILLLTI